MGRSTRRWGWAGVVLAGMLGPGALAWACVGVVSLTSGSNTVQPGGTLTVTGREFAAKVPVDIHLDSPTGPVLATEPAPAPSTMTSKFTVAVPVPADITPGQHMLVATQDYHDMNSGSPARTVFYVGTAPPPSPATARPAGLVSASGPGAGTLVLVGLGVAVAGVALAGGWSVLGARRHEPAEAEVAG